MSTFSNQNRPRFFKHVRGQEEAVQLLTGMVQNTSLLAKGIILSGPFGNGKTTLARIFAKALLCGHHPSGGEPCSECADAPLEGLLGRYAEMNSAGISDIEEVSTEVRNVVGSHKVLVFDEAHLLKKKIQGELLKPLEESSDLIIFVFCTTNVEELLLPLRSRCFDIRLNLMSETDLRDCILDNAQRSGVNITYDAALELGRHYMGHARDAVQGLQRLTILCKGREIAKADVVTHLGEPSEALTLQLLTTLVMHKDRSVEPILRKLIQRMDTYLLPIYWRKVLSDVIRVAHGEKPPHIASSHLVRYRRLGLIYQKRDQLWKLARLLCQPELDHASTPDQLYLLLSWMQGLLHV